jgi:hypothetical protein
MQSARDQRMIRSGIEANQHTHTTTGFDENLMLSNVKRAQSRR